MTITRAALAKTASGLATAAVVATFVMHGAFAQGTAPRDPNMPSPSQVPAEKMAPESNAPRSDAKDPSATGSTETLTDRLRRTEGVIAPPQNGAGGVIAPPPDSGSMPVIRPRGGAGDPVQPK